MADKPTHLLSPRQGTEMGGAARGEPEVLPVLQDGGDLVSDLRPLPLLRLTFRVPMSHLSRPCLVLPCLPLQGSQVTLLTPPLTGCYFDDSRGPRSRFSSLRVRIIDPAAGDLGSVAAPASVPDPLASPAASQTGSPRSTQVRPASASPSSFSSRRGRGLHVGLPCHGLGSPSGSMRVQSPGSIKVVSPLSVQALQLDPPLRSPTKAGRSPTKTRISQGIFGAAMAPLMDLGVPPPNDAIPSQPSPQLEAGPGAVSVQARDRTVSVQARDGTVSVQARDGTVSVQARAASRVLFSEAAEEAGAPSSEPGGPLHALLVPRLEELQQLQSAEPSGSSAGLSQDPSSSSVLGQTVGAGGGEGSEGRAAPPHLGQGSSAGPAAAAAETVKSALKPKFGGMRSFRKAVTMVRLGIQVSEPMGEGGRKKG